MSDIKIDEEHLEATANALENLIECLEKEIKELKDKSGDNFSRYMAYNRSYSLLKLWPAMMDTCKMNFISGHNLAHKFLQTKEAKDKNWDKMKLENHPFFINEDRDDDDEISGGANRVLSKILSKILEEKSK